MLVILALLSPALAQFGFFDHLFQQQQPQQPQQQSDRGTSPVENGYYQIECNDYLCEDTLVCVKSPIDCPCLFPASQLKCVLPDKSSYVCISKPSTEDGPNCETVNKAWRGNI